MVAQTPPTSSPARLPVGRRWLIRGLLGLATLLTVVSIFAVWANRQVLDADNWSDTSSALLQDDAIRGQIAAFATDAVFSQAEVQDQVAAALPPRLQALAGPAANALRELAERRANRLLERPKVQEAWAAANKITAQQFIAVAENKSKLVTQSGNAVVIDLRPVIAELVLRLGLPGRLTDNLPADRTVIKVMDGNQVGALQDGVGILQGLAVILPVLAVLLLALAVYLGRGRRRETLLAAGLNLMGAGLFVLVARLIAGGAVVDALAKTESVRPAAESAWRIGTDMLRDISWACVLTGIPVVLAASLAGPRRPAVAFRRAIAPTMRTAPGLAYGAMAALVLLIVAWGPIPATRKPLPVLLLLILAAAAVEVLRRQCVREFPADAIPEAEPTADGSKLVTGSPA